MVRIVVHVQRIVPLAILPAVPIGCTMRDSMQLQKSMLAFAEKNPIERSNISVSALRALRNACPLEYIQHHVLSIRKQRAQTPFDR